MLYQKLRCVVLTAVVVSMALVTLQCAGVQETGRQHRTPSAGDGGDERIAQTSAQKYAGELLSYLLQVVLGAAGDPETRQEWKTRSLYVALDFREIANIMDDHERRVSELMVYDANILGLSSVLYHYNQRLNFFKGAAFQDSVFPSEEVLAIRLLLVQKVARNEKVKMGRLMAREALLINSDAELSGAELKATNLTGEELELLRDVIRSEPFFKAYLEDPFLVEALYRVGAVELDAYVKAKIQAADYGNLAGDCRKGEDQGNVVRVAILPSMTKAFDFQPESMPGFPQGFRATRVYTRAAEELKGKLKEALRQRVMAKLSEIEGSVTAPKKRLALAEAIVAGHLKFIDLDKRPLVIYPDNAEKVIQKVCPDADFNFILLGKNVYLSIYFDEKRDIFPYVNRIYFDIMDIQRSLVDDEIDRIGEFVYKKIEPLIAVE